MNVLVSEIDQLSDPKWFSLCDQNLHNIDSRILLNVQLAPEKFFKKIDFKPPTQPMKLFVYVLGCQNLSAFLGVSKPLIRLYIPNCEPKNTVSSKKPLAKFPIYNELFEVTIEFPLRSDLFIQTMQIEVRDSVLGGLFGLSYRLGSGSVSLGNYLPGKPDYDLPG